jgi:phenylalanyl-tRNA synthetase alpha chain
MQDEMTPEQAAVLNGLEPGQAERVPELAVRLGLDQSQVAAAALQLAQHGFCAIHEEPFREWVLKEAGRETLAAGLPERRILRALLAHEGRGSMLQAAEWSGLSAKEVGQSIRGLQQRGWAAKTGAELVLMDGGRTEAELPEPDETVLTALVGAESGRLTEDELVARGCAPARARELFGPRSALIEIRDKVHRSVEILAAGEQRRAAGVTARPLVTELTPEMLSSGGWRDVRFKPYDVDLATEPRHPGKRHPLQLVVEQTRRAFFNLGFEEWHSPMVESSFWDFDALFQPQDHPAREMQDTFYVARPARSPLPADALVDRVRAVHETGGDTGSAGWQYRWSPELAQRNVLRTHNTATTIRALAEVKHGPRKVFSVGRVFRREAIDYKHLPVFFQVDGIVVDADGSLASLFGTMGAFLEQLGFTKYDFRPDFFPYTEPSVGVFVWNEERRDWFELAGAGIFRPEVTEPLGCTEPVLAWGFGLDRLAMVMGGLKDIRDLYLVDLEWLKGVPQCR